ncbi:MFS transporter [Larsenimonas suaedae]|uniref:MFS transporter n=1 Tax=Larsenimonas suaedae TaxID=1851019 RepID=A0ABU1GWM2_9GAMM|nr:MFS transporter [Larsenimonas suaedae]MCM2972992.1 MFS transporter [Larsenimonas suaedae]MDR5896429.1 MFS transporter [Larsenimonas suaedae]
MATDTQDTPPQDSTLTRAFEALTHDEDARTCKDIPDSACNQQPGNFIKQLLGSLGNKLADELASARLILPWLLGALGAPGWMVGLLVPIREAGALLPQVLVAGLIRPLPQRKYVWASGSAIQAAAAFALALVALWGGGSVGGTMVLVALVILSLARGVTSIATKDVLGKTIDKQKRGQLMGWSGSLAGGATLAAGAILIALGNQPSRAALVVLLVIASIGWLVNALCALRLKEEDGATEGGSTAFATLKDGVKALKRDREFRRFNLARTLLLGSALALPYMALLAQNNSDENLKGLGVLILISGIASMIASPLWGKRADRGSHLVMRNGGLIAAAAAFLAALAALLPFAWTQTVWPFALLYAVMIIAHTGIRLGRKTYVVDLAGQKQRALYVAMSNTLTGILLLVFGAVIGVTAHLIGSAWTLILLTLSLIIAAMLAQRLHNVEQ